MLRWNYLSQVFIQDLLFDEFGHATGVSTATASDDNTTYTAGSGLELNGTEFDVRAGDGIQISSDNVAVDNTVVRTTETYENPALYAWFLKQQRRKNDSRAD